MIKSVREVLNYQGSKQKYKSGKDVVIQRDYGVVEYRYNSEHNWCICVQDRNKGVFAIESEGNRGAKNREDIYRTISSRQGLREVAMNEI